MTVEFPIKTGPPVQYHEIDDDVADADWTKTGWPYGKNLKLAIGMISSIGPHETAKQNAEYFMSLPVAKYMPANVRDALVKRDWIEQNHEKILK